MLLAGTNLNELAALKSKLNDTFDMKDMGDASHILGMRIVRNRDKKSFYLSLLASWPFKDLLRLHVM